MFADDPNAARGLEVFPHERIVFVNGRPLELTPREFDILTRLASHPGWVYSSEQLADGEDEAADHSPDSVRVHVANIRRKMALAEATDVVGTVRGAGYRLQGGDVAVIDGSADGEHTDAFAQSAPVDIGEGARVCSRRIRDSFWMLEEAVVELEQTRGGREVVEAACGALDEARDAIAALLGEGTPDTL